MKKPLIIEPEAQRDIVDAYDWYEHQRPGLGDDFALCLDAGLQIIRERPRSFPKVFGNVRRILFHRFPYLVLFIEHRHFIPFTVSSIPAAIQSDGKTGFREMTSLQTARGE